MAWPALILGLRVNPGWPRFLGDKAISEMERSWSARICDGKNVSGPTRLWPAWKFGVKV